MPDLLIMAAGMGSRYGGLKQMEPVGPSGEWIMDYSVFDALRAGVERAVFVLRREMLDDFRNVRGRLYEGRVEVAYAIQGMDDIPAGLSAPAGRTKPWGTGHAVWAAREQMRRPFIVINADDFYGADGFAQLARFLGQPPEPPPETHALIAYALANTLSEHGPVARGICRVSPDGDLEGIDERLAIEGTNNGAEERLPDGAVRRFTGAEPTSMNLWGLRPSLLSQLEERFFAFLRSRGHEQGAEFFLPHAASDLIREGKAKVRVLTTAATWFGVTYRADRETAVRRIRDLVAAGEYPERLWS